MNKIRKTPAVLDWPSLSFKEFVGIGDDNVRTLSIMADKDSLEFVQSSKNIIDADYDDEHEMHNVGPVPTSSKMRNITRSYLDTQDNDKIINKMGDIERCVDNLMR
ncbi:hypothetical protein TNCV_5027181 [Trichonephila clavipes]|nr:hypothetical protein TNCV_5027181 [Trichonephila clavipes]